MRPPDAPADTRLTTSARLSAVEAAAVFALVEVATDHDGVPPLSEHATLHLRYGGDVPARHILLWRPSDHGSLAGYAHLGLSDPEGPSAELVIAPADRGAGLGRFLAERVLAEAPGRLRLWAHGGHPAAFRLARALGFEQVRTLWQMRRSLFAPLAEARPPDGVSIRSFRPGHDEEAWLALNARAFAGHPEQGAWTLDDLRRRIKEAWFDPAGFFLAERDADGRLIGFHWTKIHGGRHDHGHEALGEVYVVGVDPGQRGGGLGRALTLVGLHWLRSRGLAQAMLYVEADNAAAIRVYSTLGFTHWDTDVMFRRG